MKPTLTAVLLTIFLPIVPISAIYTSTNPSGIPSSSSNQPIRPRQPLKGYHIVDTQGLEDLITSGKVTILDSRPLQYDDGSRIPGALSLPYNSTTARIRAALPDVEATIVTYCSGPKCPMGNYLAETLVKMGYHKVMKYTEGLEGWRKAGNQIDHVPVTQRR